MKVSSKDRRPYETATSLTQQLLDFSQDNLEGQLQLIVEVEIDQRFSKRTNCGFVFEADLVSSVDHRLVDDDKFIFETAGVLPVGLVAGQEYFVVNSNSFSFQISNTQGGVAIGLSDVGSGTHQVSEAPGKLRISDRNIFVGNRFYEARTNFPVISRTIGEWLSPTVEFSSFNLKINNTDGYLNEILPGGKYFSGQVNKEINVKLGLRDVEASYFNIFRGFITPVGGFKRDTKVLHYIARDNFDRLNEDFPNDVFKEADYPKINKNNIGQVKPIIYGDYVNSVETEGNVPGIIVNGNDPRLEKQEVACTLTIASPCVVTQENHYLDANDKIQFTTSDSLPTGLSVGTDYYVKFIDANSYNISLSSGGSNINTSGSQVGQHNTQAQDFVNIRNVISATVNLEFNTSDVWLLRSDNFYRINSNDIVNVSNNNYFEVVQDSGVTKIDTDNYLYSSSDVFLVKVKGENLLSFSDNVIEQARDILKTYGGAVSADFDANWNDFAGKVTPTESATSNIKSRVYIGDKKEALEYVLSMLEQVRVELFISKDLKIKLSSLHFDEFVPSPSYVVRNFDVELGSTKVSIDERNVFNRVQGFYDFNPSVGKNTKKTLIAKNQASIDQSNITLSKKVEFPNLYIESDVENQVQEILRISAGFNEFIATNLTSRALLLDVGNFVKVNIRINGTVWENVPMMIREIGYHPDMKLIVKLWSFQMLPFLGWEPNYEGTTGGYNATITQE